MGTIGLQSTTTYTLKGLLSITLTKHTICDIASQINENIEYENRVKNVFGSALLICLIAAMLFGIIAYLNGDNDDLAWRYGVYAVYCFVGVFISQAIMTLCTTPEKLDESEFSKVRPYIFGQVIKSLDYIPDIERMDIWEEDAAKRMFQTGALNAPNYHVTV
jgi:hypothetical protein